MGFKVRRSWRQIARCPHEDLESPSRVHVDPYGNVHLCRGLLMGNIWERSFSALVRDYAAGAHPICGPLVEGGPAALAERHGVSHEGARIRRAGRTCPLQEVESDDETRFLGAQGVHQRAHRSRGRLIRRDRHVDRRAWAARPVRLEGGHVRSGESALHVENCGRLSPRQWGAVCAQALVQGRGVRRDPNGALLRPPAPLQAEETTMVAGRYHRRRQLSDHWRMIRWK